MSRALSGFMLFMNWFDGILAPLFGLLMMFGAMDAIMPLSIFDSFPAHELFFTSFFWPGLALLLVNGVPNIIALIFRFRSRRHAWKVWSLIAGLALIVWTIVELIFMPNAASVLYLVLGIIQVAASALMMPPGADGTGTR